MSKVLGIDLGTTNSCMAYMEDGKITVIPNAEGSHTTPSIVAFNDDNDRLVGEPARRQMSINPKRTVTSIKREMGTPYRASINGKSYTPQELSAMILQKLKLDAQQYLQETITDAIITVPAYFTDAQRQATKDAGRIAGLRVLRIINEPTAAALAYGLDHDYGQKIMVFDLGGGTFDVSIIEIGDGVIEVLSTSGDNHLGGDDFNDRICEHVLKQFKKDTKIDLHKDPVALQRVKEASEKAKIDLSSAEKTTIQLPFIASNRQGPCNLEMELTRATFQSLTTDLIERLSHPVNNALRDAGLTSAQLDKVILVGGSTRMPAVVQKVKQLTGKEPNKNLNPDECVASGAAIQGAKLSGNALVLGGYDVLLLDVTPLSLSIETVGGVATVIIPRNTTVPCSHSQIFTTAANFQTSVNIHVLQGERQMAADNKTLGKFVLSGIKRALRGTPQIEVTFDIDANGIVHVSAKDLGTGKEQSITISDSGNMSDADIERAVWEAKQYEEEDLRKKERVTFKNDAEQIILAGEAKLNEKKKEWNPEQKKEFKDALDQVKKLVRKTKFEKISDAEFQEAKDKKEKLERLIQTL